MSSGALYNEFDPYAAEWLRNLISAGLIAAGDVDERDVRDLIPTELMGRRQVHLFAGIGCWSFALRLAGWPDERPVWTCSCPCGPFSAAGKRGGFADERHLWPAAFHLIRECRPVAVFGEQVASPDGLLWFDLVSADLESCGYTVGAAVLPAAGVGAPHQRHRLWFVADASGSERGRSAEPQPGARLLLHAADGGATDGVADAVHRDGRGGECGAEAGTRQDRVGRRGPSGGGAACSLGNTGGAGLPAREREALFRSGRRAEGRATMQPGGASGGLEHSPSERPLPAAHAGIPPTQAGGVRERGRLRGGPAGPDTACGLDHGERPGPLNGFWRAADWLFCTDGLWRPVAPGSFPLGNGIANRVAQLRAAGNALVPEEAAEFIGAYREVREAL